MPAVSKASPANTARVGTNTASIFKDHTHLLLPLKDAKPSKNMLYLFHTDVPENMPIEHILKVMPSWISLFFSKFDNHETTVTASKGNLLNGKPVSHPLYSLTHFKKGNRLELNQGFFRYKYETEKTPRLEWGINNAILTSSEKPSFSSLKVRTPGNLDGWRSEDISKRTKVLAFHPYDKDMPVLLHDDKSFKEIINFPTSLKNALEYFGIPNITTFNELKEYIEKLGKKN
jgi:hypothetical protein